MWAAALATLKLLDGAERGVRSDADDPHLDDAGEALVVDDRGERVV